MESSRDINKKDVRKFILKKRSLMAKKEWEEKSHCIYKKVTAHPFFLNAKEIYCYVNFKNEVDTLNIIKKAWELNKKVAVPKVIGDEMHFFYIKSFSELKEGYRQIMEPVTEVMAEGKDVLIIMPGAVFDKDQNRIGYGKGFYDRYLEKHASYQTLALAFELQFVENIPAEIHDKRPTVIVTEEKVMERM